ncbi:hypothetical protein [Pectobacterium aquaticum]|uniref:hypothetical protein n=1 Tax=Pectobacterium aquaticum TaxID=2204145 RepID=UPI000E2532B7|nr:hypothetical protein [Pectobacterium aquaticum]
MYTDGFNTLMHRNFQRLLVDSGWPEKMETFWSLSFSQRDYVEFRGQLDTEELVELLVGLGRSGELTQREVTVFSLLVQRKEITLALREYGISFDGMPDRYPACRQRMLNAFKQSVRARCDVAKEQGYKLIDALSPPYGESAVLFERSTRHFIVRASQSESLWLFDGDEQREVIDGYLDSIFRGERLLAVKLEVLTKDDSVLADDLINEVLIPGNVPVREWFCRDWLSDVMDEARETIRNSLCRFSSFEPSLAH